MSAGKNNKPNFGRNFKAWNENYPFKSKRGVANQREIKQSKKKKADENNILPTGK